MASPLGYSGNAAHFKSEEIMTKAKIAVSLAVVALGAAFSAPAMAQYGRNVNDGGLVNVSGAQPQAYQYYNYNYAPASAADYKYPAGRNVNDGGLVPTPPAVRQPRAAAATPAPAAPHYGRNPDDGGLVN